MEAVKKRKHPLIGMDIGNGFGNTAILWKEGENPIPLLPAYKELGDGMPTTAYVTPPDGKRIEVFTKGKSAENKYKRKPDQLVRAAKTRLKEISITIPGIEKPVEVKEIYRAIARDLIQLSEEELKNKGMDPIYDVVFTFPAVFADDIETLDAMQSSIESIRIEDHPIKVKGRFPEPAAIAIDFLNYMQHLAPENIRIAKDEYTVLVYDLGHGTFDVAVCTARSKGVPYQLHSKDGLPELGGRDFDEILYREITTILQEKYNYTPKNENQREEIRREAAKIKLELTESENAVAHISTEMDYLDVEISRTRFEELSQHLMVQTLSLVHNVMEESAAAGTKIDAVVLSGGASRMPMVRRNMEEMLEGEYPIYLHRPSEAVAFGAAIFGSGIPEDLSDTDKSKEDPEEGENKDPKNREKNKNQLLQQNTDCCYGIWLPTAGSLEGVIEFLIPVGSSRPAVSKTASFYSPSSRVKIKLYRSKEKNKELSEAKVEECDSILWFTFHVHPGAKCQVQITAREDYGLEVELNSDKGDHQKKTTADSVEQLVS